ncbi:MAG: META domain-containing protein [Treponema sp.]|jgi:hypothetical protein|nr:META domain-containing protein [Treponema sp.]
MKRHIFLYILLIAFIMSCASNRKESSLSEPVFSSIETEPAEITLQPSAPVFSDITGKDWMLTGVFIGGADTLFSRENLPRENGRNYFTLKFDSGTVSGTGAPNRFSAPYTSGDNNSVSILPMRSTLMAALFEPENLKEHEFYVYLQNASAWKLADEKLTLFSKTKDEQEARLVFGF